MSATIIATANAKRVMPSCLAGLRQHTLLVSFETYVSEANKRGYWPNQDSQCALAGGGV